MVNYCIDYTIDDISIAYVPGQVALLTREDNEAANQQTQNSKTKAKQIKHNKNNNFIWHRADSVNIE